jgi:REP element-mobilizing transposase RayT
MPREPRVWEVGAVYHLFSRGSNRQAIYLNEGDYVEFELLMHEAASRHGLDTYAWSLMQNHWHLVAACPAVGLSQFVKLLNQRYAIRFDRRWGRTGHVFQNRFRAVRQATEEQFLWTLRYVVTNPVTARICASPFDARWTSFAATAGLVTAPTHLRVDEILAHFDKDPEQARIRYVEFIIGSASEGSAPESGVPAWATAR